MRRKGERETRYHTYTTRITYVIHWCLMPLFFLLSFGVDFIIPVSLLMFVCAVLFAAHTRHTACYVQHLCVCMCSSRSINLYPNRLPLAEPEPEWKPTRVLTDTGHTIPALLPFAVVARLPSTGSYRQKAHTKPATERK